MKKSKEWENARRGFPVNISESENKESNPKVTEESLDQYEKDYIKILKERERRKINESLWSAIRIREK